MLDRTGVGGGTTGIATVTASVSARDAPSEVVSVAVMFATPFATAVTSPVAGSKSMTASAVSSDEKFGVGIGPANGFPNWSKPRTDAVTVWPAEVRVMGPAVAIFDSPWKTI